MNAFLKSNNIIKCVVIICLGLFIYGQTFHGDFVFDDLGFIVNNPLIQHFSRVSSIWHSFPLTRSIGFYSFAFNYYLNGLHPEGYHIFNFIIHLIATILVWLLVDLLMKITGWFPSQSSKVPKSKKVRKAASNTVDQLKAQAPFLVAIIFLVHPCQTQAISYITQRFESMATVFYLGAVYCYLRARVDEKQQQKIIFFGASILLTFLGILTKEVIMTVPLMIIAGEWILFPNKDNAKFYLGLGVGGVLLYGLLSHLLHSDISIFTQTIHSESHDGDILTPGRYLLTQMRVFLTFLRLLLIPIDQNMDYDYPASTGLLSPPLTLLGLTVMGLFVAAIIKLRQTKPLIAFGLAWMLITFSINLAPRSNVIFEHKLYLLSFGFILALTVFLFEGIVNRQILGLIFLAITVILSFLTYERNHVWQNAISLWSDTVEKSPFKSRPNCNLGFAYCQIGDYDKALPYLNKAIELNPKYTEAYSDRAIIEDHGGEPKEAMRDFDKAIDLNPDYAKAYVGRGALYSRQGLYTSAITDFSKAVELNPYDEGSLINLAICYAKQRNFDQALSVFDKVISLDPNNSNAYFNRGSVYAQEGKLEEALADSKKAVKLDPQNTDAYTNLGYIYAKENKLDEAINYLSQAIIFNPKLAVAYNNRAILYYQLKKYDESWQDVKQVEGLGYQVDAKFLVNLKKAIHDGR